MNKIKPFIFPACVIIIMILFHCFFLIYKVQGSSMVPTLSDKKLGIAVRTSVAQIDRFDIVVIETDDKYLVKRVIGLPNEKIEYKDGKLYINDIEYEDDDFSYLTEDFQIIVNDGEYFCLGDNRENSVDSRSLGNFKKDMIKAILFSH